MFVCMYVYLCNIHIYKYIYIYIYIYYILYIYILTYMYIYIYICIYNTWIEGYRASKNNNLPTNFDRGLFQGKFEILSLTKNT